MQSSVLSTNLSRGAIFVADLGDHFENGLGGQFHFGFRGSRARGFSIYPPQLEKWAQMNPYFESGSTVDIKLCTMDDASYGYWESFAALSTFSNNVLVPYDDNLSSNVSGGEGLWAGYGTDVRKVTIP